MECRLSKEPLCINFLSPCRPFQPCTYPIKSQRLLGSVNLMYLIQHTGPRHDPMSRKVETYLHYLLPIDLILIIDSPRWCVRNGQWDKAARVLSMLSKSVFPLLSKTNHQPTDIQPRTRSRVCQRRTSRYGRPTRYGATSRGRSDFLDAAQRNVDDRRKSQTSTHLDRPDGLSADHRDEYSRMGPPPSKKLRYLLAHQLLTYSQPTQNYYAPQIFSDMGLTERNAALFATGVYGLVKMLSSLCFLLFAADSLGRRKSLLISSVGMAVTLYVVGIYEKLYTGQKTGVGCSIYICKDGDLTSECRYHRSATWRLPLSTFTSFSSNLAGAPVAGSMFPKSPPHDCAR